MSTSSTSGLLDRPVIRQPGGTLETQKTSLFPFHIPFQHHALDRASLSSNGNRNREKTQESPEYTTYHHPVTITATVSNEPETQQPPAIPSAWTPPRQHPPPHHGQQDRQPYVCDANKLRLSRSSQQRFWEQ